MKEQFEVHRFSDEGMSLIGKCNVILKDYAAQGYTLSLRQLYYQLVQRNWLPPTWADPSTGSTNNIRSYKKIGVLVSNARMAGLMDWAMIEDRGREVVFPSHWNSPADIVRTAAEQFRVDHWRGQKNYCEVFVEKDALSGILIPVCRKMDVRFTANRGYSSSSAMYEASKRLLEAADAGKDVHIFYLGDHDPSGIDMTRDVRERLEIFTYGTVSFLTVRLALNYDQVQEWNPPENPAKETDSRYTAYVHEFGESSWELDAVEPAKLAELVEEAIERVIDLDAWDEVEEQQDQMRAELLKYANEYKTGGEA